MKLDAETVGREYGEAYLEAAFEFLERRDYSALEAVSERFDREVPLLDKARVFPAVGKYFGAALAALYAYVEQEAGLAAGDLWRAAKLSVAVEDALAGVDPGEAGA